MQNWNEPFDTYRERQRYMAELRRRDPDLYSLLRVLAVNRMHDRLAHSTAK